MAHTILVLGGTGLLGQPVARRLASDGFRVRIFSRDPDKARRAFDNSFDVVAGHVQDTESLKRAMEGCWGVHVSIAGPHEQRSAEATATLAGDLGLSRIGYISGSTVDDRNRWFPMIEQKLRAEMAVEASKAVPLVLRRGLRPYGWLGRRPSSHQLRKRHEAVAPRPQVADDAR